MSRPYQYSTDGPRSPLDPQSTSPFTSGQPPSFKTNVNRAKTKRWVEAKAYSYDGDDWGGYDEDDEYGVSAADQTDPSIAESQSATGKPTGLRQKGQAMGGPVQGARSVTNPDTPTAAAVVRSDSYRAGDDRRAFSSGHPPAQYTSGSDPAGEGSQGMPHGIPHGIPAYGSVLGADAYAESPISAVSSVDSHMPRQAPDNASAVTSLPPRGSSRKDGPVVTQGQGTAEDEPQLPISSLPSQSLVPQQTQPPSFIRPADIYKRINEEREKERQSLDSDRPGSSRSASPGTALPTDSAEKATTPIVPQSILRKPTSNRGGPSSLKVNPMLSPVIERKSEYGFPGFALPDTGAQESSERSQEQAIPSSSSAPHPDTNTILTADTDDQRPGFLPQLNRLSDFGEEEWLGLAGTEPQQGGGAGGPASGHVDGHTTADSEPLNSSSLQHQPSLGYRSMVNQAFDAPASHPSSNSPFSTHGSQLSHETVSRSNTSSTSGISPIISHVPPTTLAHSRVRDAEAREKATPAITEEPDQDSKADPEHLRSSSQAASFAGELPASTFKAGYRRDLNAPSPAGSPAHLPEIDVSPQLPRPASGEVGTLANSAHSRAASDGQKLSNLKYARSESPSLPSQSADTATLPAPSTPTARSDSPTKGRVRDLAGKFNEKGDSRRSSTSSLGSRSSPTREKALFNGDDAAASEMVDSDSKLSARGNEVRPIAEREPTFRPSLPGQWQSYSQEDSSAPSEQTPAPSLRPPSPLKSSKETPKSELTPIMVAPTKTHNEQADIEPTTTKSDASGGQVVTADIHHATAETAHAPMIEQLGTSTTQEEQDIHTTRQGRAEPSGGLSLQTDTNTPRPSEPQSSDTGGSFGIPPTPPPKDASALGVLDYIRPLEPLSIPGNARGLVATPKIPADIHSLSSRPHEIQDRDQLEQDIVRSLKPASSRDAGSEISSSAQNLSSDKLQHTGVSQATQDYWRGPVAVEISTQPDKALTLIHGLQISDHHAAGIAQPPTDLGVREELHQTPPFPIDDPRRAEKTIFDPKAALSIGQSGLAAADVPMQDQEGSIPDALDFKKKQNKPHISHSEPLHIVNRTDDDEVDDYYDANPDPDNRGLLSGTVDTQHKPAGVEDGYDTKEVKSSAAPDANSNEGVESLKSSEMSSHAGAAGPQQLPPAEGLQSKIPTFREILALRSVNERIQAYDSVRAQFVQMDTGLQTWMRAATSRIPESYHTASETSRAASNAQSVPSQSSQPAAAHPQQQPHFQQYLDSSSSVQRPSIASSSNSNAQQPPASTAGTRVASQSKSKDILHTATIFGGKATTSAKGLLAKGRSKFRNSTSDKAPNPETPPSSSPWDKGFSPFRRRSRPTSFIGPMDRLPRLAPNADIAKVDKDVPDLPSEPPNPDASSPAPQARYTPEALPLPELQGLVTHPIFGIPGNHPKARRHSSDLRVITDSAAFRSIHGSTIPQDVEDEEPARLGVLPSPSKASTIYSKAEVHSRPQTSAQPTGEEVQEAGVNVTIEEAADDVSRAEDIPADPTHLAVGDGNPLGRDDASTDRSLDGQDEFHDALEQSPTTGRYLDRQTKQGVGESAVRHRPTLDINGEAPSPIHRDFSQPRDADTDMQYRSPDSAISPLQEDRNFEAAARPARDGTIQGMARQSLMDSTIAAVSPVTAGATVADGDGSTQQLSFSKIFKISSPVESEVSPDIWVRPQGDGRLAGPAVDKSYDDASRMRSSEPPAPLLPQQSPIVSNDASAEAASAQGRRRANSRPDRPFSFAEIPKPAAPISTGPGEDRVYEANARMVQQTGKTEPAYAAGLGLSEEGQGETPPWAGRRQTLMTESPLRNVQMPSGASLRNDTVDAARESMGQSRWFSAHYVDPRQSPVEYTIPGVGPFEDPRPAKQAPRPVQSKANKMYRQGNDPIVVSSGNSSQRHSTSKDRSALQTAKADANAEAERDVARKERRPSFFRTLTGKSSSLKTNNRRASTGGLEAEKLQKAVLDRLKAEAPPVPSVPAVPPVPAKADDAPAPGLKEKSNTDQGLAAVVEDKTDKRRRHSRSLTAFFRRSKAPARHTAEDTDAMSEGTLPKQRSRSELDDRRPSSSRASSKTRAERRRSQPLPAIPLPSQLFDSRYNDRRASMPNAVFKQWQGSLPENIPPIPRPHSRHSDGASQRQTPRPGSGRDASTPPVVYKDDAAYQQLREQVYWPNYSVPHAYGGQPPVAGLNANQPPDNHTGQQQPYDQYQGYDLQARAHPQPYQEYPERYPDPAWKPPGQGYPSQAMSGQEAPEDFSRSKHGSPDAELNAVGDGERERYGRTVQRQDGAYLGQQPTQLGQQQRRIREMEFATGQNGAEEHLTGSHQQKSANRLQKQQPQHSQAVEATTSSKAPAKSPPANVLKRQNPAASGKGTRPDRARSAERLPSQQQPSEVRRHGGNSHAAAAAAWTASTGQARANSGDAAGAGARGLGSDVYSRNYDPSVATPQPPPVPEDDQWLRRGRGRQSGLSTHSFDSSLIGTAGRTAGRTGKGSAASSDKQAPTKRDSGVPRSRSAGRYYASAGIVTGEAAKKMTGAAGDTYPGTPWTPRWT